MSVARDWYDALDPAMRELVLHVMAKRSNPTDEQIEELPDLVRHQWSLDATGMAEDVQPSVRAVIAELKTRLGRKPPRKPGPKPGSRKRR